MSSRRILVLNGNPDPSRERFSAALAQAYIRGASAAGHQIRRLDIGEMSFPLIGSREMFMNSAPPEEILGAQEAIRWADHLVLIFPLWLGAPPALLKGFFEQTLRYGFALSRPGDPIKGLLKGKSARLIVTMGMPALAFRLIFGAFGLRALERGMLALCGVKPIRHTILGMVEGAQARREGWLKSVERLGTAAL